MPKNLPNKRVHEIMQEALNHARKTILKGSTQIENNFLLNEQKSALKRGVNDAREQYYNNTLAYDRAERALCYLPQFDSVANLIPFLLSYENEITTSAKYSLGNCAELALHFFDYIVNHPDNVWDKSIVQAELCQIENKSNYKFGDHVFVVINRKKNSDISDPTTWGEHAYICDPWSAKHHIYPAADYLKYLKNFLNLPTGNFVEPFDHGKHTIQPFKNKECPIVFESTDFNKLETILDMTLDNSFPNAIEKIKNYLNILKIYEDKLIEFKRELTTHYHAPDNKIAETQKIIEALDKGYCQIENLINQAEAFCRNLDNLTTRQKLDYFIYMQNDMSNKIIHIFNTATQLPTESKNVLLKPHEPTFFQEQSQLDIKINLELANIVNEVRLLIEKRLINKPDPR